MKLALSCALLASALLGLSACNKAQSPDKVQADVAKAQSDAVAENAKADEQQKQVQAAVDKNVGALVDNAVIQAEGETKVALAKCEALEGDAQKECKDTANAHMDSVREKAKAAKAG